MTVKTRKQDGYLRLYVSALADVEAARRLVAAGRPGAAHKLRDAEKERDRLLRMLDERPAVPAGSYSLPETLRGDFGTDEDAPR